MFCSLSHELVVVCLIRVASDVFLGNSSSLLIPGAPDSGKTTLIKDVVERLHTRDLPVLYLSAANLSAEEFWSEPSSDLHFSVS